MTLAPTDALLDRAERAIADAIATRAEVRAGLMEAWQRRPYWPHWRPSCPTFPEPVDWAALEPWWCLARTLGPAEVLRAADEALECEWQRTLPTLKTPLDARSRELAGYAGAPVRSGLMSATQQRSSSVEAADSRLILRC